MSKKKSLNAFLLSMIIISTVLSLRSWPMTAEAGAPSLFFVLLAALGFLVPLSLVSAELASAWPEKGGVFVWVKKAFGHRMGFLAVWLLWIENIFWYPTILSFVAASAAYFFFPEMRGHTLFTFLTIVTVYWVLTFVNLRGIKISGWISALSVIFGTFIPGLLIIGLGSLWVIHGGAVQIEMRWEAFLPRIEGMGSFAFLAGVLLSFGGMEMPALHAKDVEKPQKNYPRAIFFALFVIITMTLFGTLSILLVIPREQIHLISGSLDAVGQLLNAYGVGWSIPIVSLLIIFGALGTVSTWIAGPCRGLLAAAEAGDLPPSLHQENKHGMPARMMLIQGGVVTALASLFLFLPDVSSSYWVLIVMAAALYCIMYILLFAAGIVLRYKEPGAPRLYRVPGGNAGMWILGSVGLLSSLFVFLTSFLPPSHLDRRYLFLFESALIGGILVACLIPFFILAFKKKSWTKKSCG